MNKTKLIVRKRARH